MPSTFSTDINVLGPHRVVLHGTAASPNGVAGVELTSDGTDLGSATINADGTWTLTDSLDATQTLWPS